MNLYTIVDYDANAWYEENKKPFISNDLKLVENKLNKLACNVVYENHNLEVININLDEDIDENTILYSVFINKETDEYINGLLDLGEYYFVYFTTSLCKAKEQLNILGYECKPEIVKFTLAKNNKAQTKEEGIKMVAKNKTQLVLDSAKVEAVNGLWQATTEKAIDIVCAQTIKALKKAKANGVVMEYVGLALETKIGKSVLAFVVGNCILVFYNGDPKTARLGEEIRTYGWRNSFSFLFDSVVEPVMGQLKEILKSVPDIKD